MLKRAHIPVLAAKIAANVARERLFPKVATSVEHVPASASALTTEWLTAVLCRNTPAAAVTDFEVVGGSDGTSSRRALRVQYNPAGAEAGLPTRLFMKSATSFQSRLMLGLGGVTQCETIFYRDIRPELDRLRSPRAFHAAVDSRTYGSIVLMDDLSAEGWTFPDPMKDSISRQDAEDMVDQMAYYHAAFWGDPRLAGLFAQLPTTELFQQRLNDVGLEKRACSNRNRARTARHARRSLPAQG